MDIRYSNNRGEEGGGCSILKGYLFSSRYGKGVPFSGWIYMKGVPFQGKTCERSTFSRKGI